MNDHLSFDSDIGIILDGSWQEGFFNVLFAKNGYEWVRRGTIKRIAIRKFS